ncbi:branched-chain amino acid ABC transporter permease [Ramlibacter sp. RBP-2]|uniref:Branched-chain amino acid ABC transporter permease n=1 Tax=Ramlibacter lithotrophicus TaxID=2606681 RepID=A0A7X6DE51_9BURK|nr:branched-chain amino acid ABC transporter permease [Ramlibacter lithotrophicus]NKE65507.1 branched-chain amino acid ABC transporter permease [Ramlibacter lithotrophicus]
MKPTANLWQHRLRFDMRAALAICGLIALVPLFVTGPYALGIILVSVYFAILALAWNLLAGYTGQFSLAPAAFAMIGGYTTALLDFYWKVPLALGIPAAIVVAALFGLVLGKLVLNLSGPYLSLTTLAFAEIARVVIGNSHEFTRGDQGMHVATLMQSRVGYYYVFLATLVAVLLGLYWLLKGRLGRFMMAVRDDPVGAESRGIDVVRTKMIAFCVSCAICGLAGSLYGTFSQLVSPELGLLQQTGLVLSMVVIGGMSSLSGAILGAILVYLGSEWLREFGDIQIIVFALLVILFARYVPAGLWGFIAARLQGRKT